MTVDRDPLVTIARMALKEDGIGTVYTLERILAFAWDQLAQRCNDNKMADVLSDLGVDDLLPALRKGTR